MIFVKKYNIMRLMSQLRQSIQSNRRALSGFAALLIYIFHGWKPVFSSTPGLFEIEYAIVHFGDIGVDIFLFLSGMGLVNSWKHCSSYREFILRRLKRIFVPALITGGVFLLLSEDLLDGVKAVTGYYFLIGRMNTYLWFYFAIVLLYLFFPLYYHFFDKARSKILFTSCVIAIWIVYLFLLNDHVNNWAYIFLNRIPVFLIGICFDHLTDTKIKIHPILLYGISLTALAIGLNLSILTKVFGKYPYLPHSYALFPYILMSVSLIILLSRVFDLIPHRILDFYGLFTFEFYCVQERVLQILEDVFNDLPALPENIVALALSTICACLLFQINQVTGRQLFRQRSF